MTPRVYRRVARTTRRAARSSDSYCLIRSVIEREHGRVATAGCQHARRVPSNSLSAAVRWPPSAVFLASSVAAAPAPPAASAPTAACSAAAPSRCGASGTPPTAASCCAAPSPARTSLDPFISGFRVFLGSDLKGSSEIDRGFGGFWVQKRKQREQQEQARWREEV